MPFPFFSCPLQGLFPFSPLDWDHLYSVASMLSDKKGERIYPKSLIDKNPQIPTHPGVNGDVSTLVHAIDTDVSLPYMSYQVRPDD